MTDAPRISEAEWRVMETLWERHPLGAAEVAAELGPVHGWSEATVKTMLGRLVKKGALRYRQDGRRYLYEPAVQRDECVRSEALGLLERVFGGRTSPMLEWFVRETKLSARELAELQALLDREQRRRRS